MAEKPKIQIGNVVISVLMIMAGIVMVVIPSSVPVKICGCLIVILEVAAILRSFMNKKPKQ